ncbi:MAG: hypothetical protein LBQ38_07165 [Spirochaetaceae bacterium]|jgi:hypothetical protein|nr:hypothetical protein [Spirochaetaceae bacterium]
MKDSFLTQFTNKASNAHKKSADCFKAQDYIGFLVCYFEEGYYQTLAYAVNGQDQENGQPVIDKFWSFFKVEQQGNSRITQALKKLGKLEKIPIIEAVIQRFFNDASTDFLALSNKSTQINYTLMNMGSWEKIGKGLTNNINNEVDAVDKLFMEDKISMGIITRRKSSGYINRLKKEIQDIVA